MTTIHIPGPSIREQDFSSYIRALSDTVFGIVGTATKGEFNTPISVTNPSDFISKLGRPIPESPAMHAAMFYLEQGHRLWFVRVGGSSKKKSSFIIPLDEEIESSDPENPDPENPDPENPDSGRGFNVTGKTEGTEFDGIRIQISDVEGTDFTVGIIASGRLLERFRVSTVPSRPDHVVKVVNAKSRFVNFDPLQTEPVVVKEGIYTLAGGRNGISDVRTSDYVGTDEPKTGLKVFKSDHLDLDVIATPGVTDPAVINAGLQLAASRGEFIYLVDTPFGMNAQEVADWHNGTGQGSGHQAFNSSYGAMYWSWQEVYDPYSGQNLWHPPSSLVAAAIAYNDKVAEPWYAPAGFRRGRLPQVLRSEVYPDEGERSLLYTAGNAINPIMKHPNAGIAIFGQRTLQREPSATDRLNVRRLLLKMRKAIAGTTLYLTFEPNDSRTWNEFEDMIEPYLRGLKNRRALYAYRIVMNESTVTPDDIDNYSMPGKIFIQPTKAAEEIPIDFVLTSTGAIFEDYLPSLVS